MAGSAVKMKIIDYPKVGRPLGEASHCTFPGLSLTAANFDAQATLMSALRTAVQGIILGNIAKEERVAVITEPDASAVEEKHAQRENKWLCRYQVDTTNERRVLSIPTADLDALGANSEDLDLADGDVGEAFKTAFEAYVRIYDDVGGAHTVTLLSATFVGRNL
jgi:hypothetical protein